VATVLRAFTEGTAGLLCRFVLQPVASAAAVVEPQELRLGAHDLWSGTVSAGTTVLCRQGALWVTRTGDPHDHVLRAGQAMQASGGGHLVISTFATDSVAAISPTP
jgi:hypothetical protein